MKNAQKRGHPLRGTTRALQDFLSLHSNVIMRALGAFYGLNQQNLPSTNLARELNRLETMTLSQIRSAQVSLQQ